jgi:hypothetical protein
MTEEDFGEGYFRLRRGGAMERGRRGHLLAFGMQDREAIGAPPRADAEHARAETTTPLRSPGDPGGTVPSSAMGSRWDKHPMAPEEAQASVPSRACPSPGRRGAIPAATSNTCASFWAFRCNRDEYLYENRPSHHLTFQ